MLAINAIHMLGQRGRDKITGYEGYITSVSLDLYGCVQLGINPGKGDDGKLLDATWFDCARVEVTDPNRIMPVPPQFLEKAEEAQPKNYHFGPETGKPAPR